MIASVIAHFRTSRRKRFSISFTLKREHDDSISNMNNVTRPQHDDEDGQEIIPE